MFAELLMDTDLILPLNVKKKQRRRDWWFNKTIRQY